jgi:hypothetical protein
LLVGTRLEALLKTEVYQKFFANRRFEALESFTARTGLDPRKDLWELLYASNGKEGVLMGRGKFASGEMEPRLEKEGARRFAYKGFTLVGNEQAAVLLWGPGLAMVGPTPSLYWLVDKRGQASGPPSPLAALMRGLPSGSQFWAVYAGAPIKLPFDERSNLANINRMIQSIQSGTFAADLSSGFDAVARGNCDTDENARQIHDAMKGLIGIGRLSTRDDQQDLLRVYDSIQVSQAGREVKVEMHVPREQVERFLSVWMPRR